MLNDCLILSRCLSVQACDFDDSVRNHTAPDDVFGLGPVAAQLIVQGVGAEVNGSDMLQGVDSTGQLIQSWNTR